MSTPFRLILVGLLTLILIGDLGYEIYMLADSQNQIQAAVTAADERIGSDSRTRGILSFQETYAADLALIDEIVLTNTDLVTLAEEIESAGRSLGLTVSISSITGDSRAASTAAQTVKISVEATGSWAANLSFVRILQSLPYKYVVETVDLKKEGGGWRTSSVIKISTMAEE